jgi:hypothetical protein
MPFDKAQDMPQELPENPQFDKLTTAFDKAQDMPTPQDFGFPSKPTVAQARCWANQERFLQALAQSGSVGAAAAAVGVPLQTVYNWDSVDIYTYKMRKQWALEAFMGKVETEINRRGVEGWDEPLSFKGQLTGDTVRRYSDNLLMFRAKKLDPAYKDNHQPQQASTAVNITKVVIEVRDYRGNASLAHGTAPQIVEAEAHDIVTDTGDESLSADELT